MNKLKRFFAYFTLLEKIIWCASVTLIITFFFVFDGSNYLAFSASLIGTTSLIFIAKGNPIGHALMIVFCTLYGIISFKTHYYGEMATYVFMSLPMSCYALINWLRNPYKGKRTQVRVGKLKRFDFIFLPIAAVGVTIGFYFILKVFGTANLITSTFSVATSFVAVYLNSRRTPYYAAAYAANDIVLIVLWSMASASDPSLLPVTVCFCVFLVNDSYGFTNWLRMRKKQSAEDEQDAQSSDNYPQSNSQENAPEKSDDITPPINDNDKSLIDGGEKT